MKANIKIELTAEQKQQIEQAIGKQVTAVELKPEVLEERIAPRCILIYKDQPTPK